MKFGLEGGQVPLRSVQSSHGLVCSFYSGGQRSLYSGSNFTKLEERFGQSSVFTDRYGLNVCLLPDSYVEILTNTQGNGIRRWGPLGDALVQGGAPMKEVCALVEETPGSSLTPSAM